jgi:MazG family protein
MGVAAIIELIETLRGENGCPWDRKQTPESLYIYLVEEIYELIAAIDAKDQGGICEELGDVLFQLLFLVNLYQDMGHFDFDRVVDVIVKKMTHRHPHVFGNSQVNDAEAVRDQWHKIKMKEKRRHPAADVSVLESVPGKLPALMRAYRISERAAKMGFDWSDIFAVLEKVEEELAELKALLNISDPTVNAQDLLTSELGDVLFALVNVARFAHVHPETALREATGKFEKRFRYMEKVLSDSRGDMASMTQDQLDDLWQQAKDKVG